MKFVVFDCGRALNQNVSRRAGIVQVAGKCELLRSRVSPDHWTRLEHQYPETSLCEISGGYEGVVSCASDYYVILCVLRRRKFSMRTVNVSWQREAHYTPSGICACLSFFVSQFLSFKRSDFLGKDPLISQKCLYALRDLRCSICSTEESRSKWRALSSSIEIGRASC